MSELITRRTFLKTTGAAALAVAASGMLAGCGEGYDALLNPPTFPSVSDHYQADNFSIGMSSFSGCTSNSQHESSESRGYYLYAAVSFQAVNSQVVLRTSDFTFAFDNEPFKTNKPSCTSIGNFTLNSSTEKYVPVTQRPIPVSSSTTIPIWIRLGDYLEIPTYHIGGFTVTYKNKYRFKYSSPDDSTPTFATI